MWVCDFQLGKLARFLRMAGEDVRYANRDDPVQVLKWVKEEGRTLLTRSCKWIGKKLAEPQIILQSEKLERQVKEFLEKTGYQFRPDKFFTRCLECGALLQEVEKEKIQEKVFPYTYQTQQRFYVCPNCEKVYWGGTHKARMEKKLSSILETPKL